MTAPTAAPHRTMADVRGPVTVFLIGMRVNRLRSVRAWTAAAAAMGPMLRELSSDPSHGMLGARTYWSGRHITLVSYWRSFEDLERYARADDHAHRPAWTAFYRRARSTAAAVGIWHETFTVQPGAAETLYVDMPAGFGLGGAIGAMPVTGSLDAARRRRDRDADEDGGETAPRRAGDDDGASLAA